MVAIDRGSKFEVKFPFDKEIVAKIKGIPGTRWISHEGVWMVPKAQKGKLQKLLTQYGQGQLLDMRPEQVGDIPPLPEASPEVIEFCKKNLKLQPYDYQYQGIQRGIEFKRFINGDDPGLGKTIQTIATIMYLDAFPCLVVCPATLKYNWKREFSEKFANKKVLMLTDSMKNTWHKYVEHKMCDVVVVNFEGLQKYFVESIDCPPDKTFKLEHIKLRESAGLFKSLVVDESHKLKDGHTQRSKFVMCLSGGKDVVIELTGTPFVNKIQDFIPQLVIIRRLKQFGGYEEFNRRYCSGDKAASNLHELHYRLNQLCYFRRLKKDVLKDLPDRVREKVMCSISNMAEYNKAKNDYVKYLRENRNCNNAEVQKALRGQFMVKLGILKAISAKGKLLDVYEWADRLIEAGRKVIIFCSLREIGDAILRHYGNMAVQVRGGSDASEKDRAIYKFQKCAYCNLRHEDHDAADHPYGNNDIRVIVCSIKAASEGLTLTASSDVGFVEFPWNDAGCDQCESRSHRNGQKDSVTGSYFLGKNTVDKYCYEIIESKRSIAEIVTGQTKVFETVVDDLINLFS